MLIKDDDTSTTLVCRYCGGPILPEQPYIMNSDHYPVHSESADCHPDEGWNPHMDTE